MLEILITFERCYLSNGVSRITISAISKYRHFGHAHEL